MRRIELLSRLNRQRVDDCRLVVRLIVADEVRPSVVAGCARLADLIVATRSTSDRIFVRIGTNVAPVEEAAVRVDGDPIGISMPHSEDLRPSLRCPPRKKI